MFPLFKRKISGYRFGESTFYSDKHLGVDYEAKIGDNLYAPFDGEVINQLWGRQGGMTIWFRPAGEKVIMRFLHLSEFGKSGKVKRLVDNNKIAFGVRAIKLSDIDISNSNSVHVAWIGGIDSKGNGVDNRTQEQIQKLEEIIKWYIKEFPNIKVLGHNQVANKFCPCFSVPKYLKSIGINDKNIYFTDNFNVLKWNKL